MSSAYSLRQTLLSLGRDEEVLGYIDCLAMGPIADVVGQERADWFKSSVSMAGGSVESVWAEACYFWQRAMSAAKSGIRIWLSRRCTFEVTAFSHLVSILPKNTEFELVDFTNETVGGKSAFPPIGLGVITSNQLRRGFEIIQAAKVSDFRSDMIVWRQLQLENAPLRVFNNLRLVSAPADYFDATILKHTTHLWQPAARVVGASLVDQEIQPETAEVSDMWLFDRLWHLVDVGFLETEDEPSSPKSKVRLKTK